MSIQKVLDALKRNNMNAVLVQTKEEALQHVASLLSPGQTIGAGGSVTLKECGIDALMKSGSYRFLERYDPSLSEEERKQNTLLCYDADWYFTSANAITEDGELYNVDGYGNRVSAICCGPKRIIVVAGVNKLVKNREEAILRVKRIAAPKNTVRLNKKTPCAKLGHCICDTPDFFGCSSPERICAQYVFTAYQRDPSRITVILVNESLGY